MHKTGNLAATLLGALSLTSSAPANPPDAHGFAPGTLAYHLSTNAVGHVNGIPAIYQNTVELSGFDSIGTNLDRVPQLAWSTNFWLKNVVGLSATSIGFSNQNAGCALFNGQGLATLVSPRHYLCATHMHPEEWGMIAFLDTNNVVYWRKTLARVDDGNDTSVGILNEDLPASVGYLPLLATNFEAYLPKNNSTLIQGVGMNQDMRLFGQPMLLGHNPFVVWHSNQTATNGLSSNWNVTIRGGDSSDPEMLLIHQQLVLVSHNYGVQVGPNYALEIPALNRSMHYLSTNHAALTDYQITTFPLTNWPVINP